MSANNPNRIIDEYGTKVLWCKNLHPSQSMYSQIADMLSDDMVVENIVKINNSFLHNAYIAKKKEKQAFYGYVREELLFHGTQKANVNSICTYNFDWRLCRRRKFGKGVSFTPDADYASNYCDDDYHKVMILAKVLIARSCNGHPKMKYPPNGFDTTQKPNGDVIVKYEDNEFLPCYKIYYHFEDEEEYSDDDFSDDYYYNNYYY